LSSTRRGETIDFLTTISKIEKMSVRKLKPITGQRFRVVNGYDILQLIKPEQRS
jgi:hypothetical protein